MNISRLLNQTAVYWASPVPDGRGGNTFTAGVEVDCRWEDKAVRFIDGQSGEEVLSRSRVFLGQDVDLGGYLFLGELDDLTSAAGEDPTEEAEAYMIRSNERMPDVKGQIRLRTAML